MYRTRTITVEEYLKGTASDLLYKVNDFVATLPERLGILESNSAYGPFEALDDIGVGLYLSHGNHTQSSRGHRAKNKSEWVVRKGKNQNKDRKTKEEQKA